MHSYEDVRQNNDALEYSRMVFNNFVMNELTKDFFHKAKDESVQMISDKSDINYFKDKRYRLPKNVLDRK